jgi:hypothetical protein
MFHLCSHGSRDIGRGAEPRLEGAHALHQRLSSGNKIDAALRLPEAARPRDASLYARTELSALTAGVAPYVSCLPEPAGDCGI